VGTRTNISDLSALGSAAIEARDRKVICELFESTTRSGRLSTKHPLYSDQRCKKRMRTLYNPRFGQTLVKKDRAICAVGRSQNFNRGGTYSMLTPATSTV